jgi:membrane protein implicated in regulation of membrane protease activity
MMRMIALAALAIAGMAALWYTSMRGLPYYYDAMIFVLAITCAVLLVDTSSSSRSKRPRRVISDGEGRNAPVIYDSHQIVCQIGPWKWDIEEFCTTGLSRARPG